MKDVAILTVSLLIAVLCVPIYVYYKLRNWSQ